METRPPATRETGVPHQVLSAISHELRGPLGVARGYLHLLETQAATSPTVLATVEQASRAATRMAELLDEVSEYARWARGEPSLTLTPTSLREVLATVASRVPLPLAPAVHVDVDAPADISLPTDAPRLASGLSALASTVARAHPRDRAVTLALRSTAAEHPRILIVPGRLREAPTSERPAAFERAGAGLSIALADTIVQRHGGRLVECWTEEEWMGYRVDLPRP